MGQADDLSGETIAGKYELLRLIGRGGMGAVYEGRVLSTLKRCAVKLLLTPSLAGDDHVVKRFFREARACGMIQSQHVVTAFDSGVDGAGHPFYVMELLKGEDLEQALHRLGPLSPIAATKIVYQAALGLAKAHELGIVHRDVKPANLFLAYGDDGEVTVKVLDFGVAKVKMEVFNETSISVTRTGSMLGTPLYMSPEQVKRASAIDASADVWSLGVLLFECLSGGLPWGKVDSFGELMAAILTKELPLLQDLAPWVRPTLAEVTHRAMSRDVVYRLRDANELQRALKDLLPNGARLTQGDIAALAESERNALAPRLSLADTVMLRPTLWPRSPESRATPRARRIRRLGAVVVTLAAATLAWNLRSREPVEPRVVAQQQPAPLPAPHSASSPAPEAPQDLHFQLEIAPADASVTVDGLKAPAIDGKLELVGALGTKRLVQLRFAGQSGEQEVTFTAEGLFPRKVVLPVRAKVSPVIPRGVNSGGARDEKTPPPRSSQPTTAAPAPETEQAGLSPIFN
ncbi:MAG: protein kinase [Polyangiaceae bacterium]